MLSTGVYCHAVVCRALIFKRVGGRGRVGKDTLCCGSRDPVVTLDLRMYTRSRETNDLFLNSSLPYVCSSQAHL